MSEQTTLLETPAETTPAVTPTPSASKYQPIEKPLGYFIKIGLLAFAFSALFYTFFLWENLGVSFPIFVSLLVGFILFTAKKSQKNISGFQTLLSLMIVCVSLGVGMLESDTITTINVIATISGVLYLFQSFHNTGKWSVNFGESLKNFFKTSSFGYAQYGFLKKSFDITALQSFEKKIQGIVISFLLVIIFGGLLYSGDLAFAYFVDNTLGKISFPDLGLSTFVELGIMWFVFLILSGMAFSYFTGIFETKEQEESKKDFDLSQAKMIVTSVVSLFICYLIIQASYLALGDNIISHLDFTYAEYAKKGYYELGLIACICLILVQIFFKRVQNIDRVLRGLLVGLSGIIIVFILLSAQRLNLYENAYGLTLLRWHGYMILIGLFLLFLTQIWMILTQQKFQNNFRNILLIVLLVQSTSNMMNPENFIAMYNFEKKIGQEQTQITQTSDVMPMRPSKVLFDSSYVGSLSVDSLKAKIHIYKNTSDPVIKSQYHEDLLFLKNENNYASQAWYSLSQSQFEVNILLKNFQ